MDHVEPLRVDLTLEMASRTDPPSGIVVVEGLRQPFSGWLGLALAVQAAIDEIPGESSEGLEG